MSDWTSSASMSPFDKTRTYAVTTATTSAAENGSKVRKKFEIEAVRKKPSQNEIESVRKKTSHNEIESVRKKTTQNEIENVRMNEMEHIPSAPSSELFELLCRLQSSRLDDQRCSLPMTSAVPGNPNSQVAARMTPSKIALQVR